MTTETAPAPILTGPPLFRAIIETIVDEPERWVQSDWHYSPEIGRDLYIEDYQSIFDCNTAHCIAGWACVLAFKSPEDYRANRNSYFSPPLPDRHARTLLGLDTTNAASYEKLFEIRLTMTEILFNAVEMGLLDLHRDHDLITKAIIRTDRPH